MSNRSNRDALSTEETGSGACYACYRANRDDSVA